MLTVTDQSGAEGLKVFYSGPASTSGIHLDFTVGVGAQTFFTLDSLLDDSSGAVQGEIASLEGQNINSEDRIEDMEERLEITRERLTRKFIAAEQALSRMNTLLESIRQSFALMAGEGR